MSEIQLPPEIEKALADIREKIAQEEADAAAKVQAELDRNAKIDAAKKICADACGPVSALIAASTDQREKNELINLEASIHARHAADLEASYLEFSGQREGDSNPAVSGMPNKLEANVSVLSESGGNAEAI